MTQFAHAGPIDRLAPIEESGPCPCLRLRRCSATPAEPESSAAIAHFGALQFGLGAVGGGNLIKVEMGHLAMGAVDARSDLTVSSHVASETESAGRTESFDSNSIHRDAGFHDDIAGSIGEIGRATNIHRRI